MAPRVGGATAAPFMTGIQDKQEIPAGPDFIPPCRFYRFNPISCMDSSTYRYVTVKYSSISLRQPFTF
jgi:hypothetical protein